MVKSLESVIGGLPGETVVFPGHSYGGEWSSVERERREGVLRKAQIAQIAMM
jgi:hypothetical protein